MRHAPDAPMPAPAPGDASDNLEPALRFCRLLLSHAGRALSLSNGIEAPELPPISVDARARDSLLVAAPLYFVSQLEAAMLFDAVETLAGLAVSEDLTRGDPQAAVQLHRFWTGRHNRFARAERLAIYATLFGEYLDTLAMPADAARGASNVGFEALMVDLCEALHKFDPDLPASAVLGLRISMPLDYMAEQALRARALSLINNLERHAGGVALFAARELVDFATVAVALLKTLSRAGALGSRNMWDLVRMTAERYLRRDAAPIALRVERAKSGELVLAWLAASQIQLARQESAPIVSSTRAIAPVMRAARAWLEATLALRTSEGQGAHT